MKKHIVMVCALALLGLTACGSSEEAAPTSAPTPAAPATQEAAPTAPTPAPAAPAAPSGEPIALAGPGFTAQPVRGTAGGPVEASQMGDDCVGNFPSAPQHTVQVGAEIPRLRILVNAGADADTTLAVRTPGGQTICNDDSGDPANSLNPAIDIENAAPGAYQIFVGGYSSGDAATTYQIGFSETADQAPSQIVPNP